MSEHATHERNGRTARTGYSDNGGIRCICGEKKIEHAFDAKWMCGNCRRFHDADALDRLADKTRAMEGSL